MNDIEKPSSESGVTPRLQFSAEEREAILAEFEKTTLSTTQFAALKGIHVSTLYQWRRPRRSLASASPGPMHLEEMSLAGVLGSGGWAAEVISPKGWTLRLRDCDSAQLESLLEAVI